MRQPPTTVLCITAFIIVGCGRADHGKRPVIGVAQVSSLAPLDEAREGFYKALADSGFVRDVNVTFIERNAQGDVPTLSLIMRDFIQQGVTQVATLSSIATQTAIKSITDRPVIFGAVANPYLIGAGTSATSHRPNVTGAEIPLPVDSTLAVAVATFPSARVWARCSTRRIHSPSSISTWRSERRSAWEFASSASRVRARRISPRPSRHSTRRVSVESCSCQAS